MTEYRFDTGITVKVRAADSANAADLVAPFIAWLEVKLGEFRGPLSTHLAWTDQPIVIGAHRDGGGGSPRSSRATRLRRRLSRSSCENASLHEDRKLTQAPEGHQRQVVTSDESRDVPRGRMWHDRHGLEAGRTSHREARSEP
jgi:hypothetical protein